jgi:hypothetical protein
VFAVLEESAVWRMFSFSFFRGARYQVVDTNGQKGPRLMNVPAAVGF